MAIILFNAFSSLQKRLKEQGRPFSNVSLEIEDGTPVEDLIKDMGLDPEDVEVTFINGRPENTVTSLHHGDRVAILPPGTPGPYRVLLGMVRKQRGTK